MITGMTVEKKVMGMDCAKYKLNKVPYLCMAGLWFKIFVFFLKSQFDFIFFSGRNRIDMRYNYKI